MRRIHTERVIQNVKRITRLTNVLKIRHVVVTVVGKCRIEQNRVPRQFHHHKRLHVVRYEATNARQARRRRCDIPLRHHIRVVGIVPATRGTQSSLHTLDQLHLRLRLERQRSMRHGDHAHSQQGASLWRRTVLQHGRHVVEEERENDGARVARVHKIREILELVVGVSYF